MADRNALMAGYQSRGGVLDTLGLPPVQPAQAPSLMQALTDYAGRGLGVVDHWAMGIPSTMAGLMNGAIPGQPLGDLWSAKSAAQDARSAVAQSGYADMLALPEAFAGALGNVPAYAKPAAQLAPPAARQAGRLAESAIDPVYNALPDNSVGMFAGDLGIKKAYRGSGRDFDQASNASGTPGVAWYGLSPEVAEPFAHNITDRKAAKAAATTADDFSNSRFAGGSIMPVKIKPGADLFDYRNDSDVIKFRQQLSENTGWPSSDIEQVVKSIRLGEFEALENPIVVDAVKRAGFDGWLSSEVKIGVPDSVALFNERNVAESQFGQQMSMGDGSAGGRLTPSPGITAYHGSPHDFDRFSMDKIGTGEGAQAYGHGLYFAENDGVAKQYRKNLSSADGGIDQIAQTLVGQAGGDWAKARQKFESEALSRVQNARSSGLNYELPSHDVATLQSLRKGEPGRMYEVRINASPDDFLDWDKPLSQQSEKVRGALPPDLPPDMTGQQAMNEVREFLMQNQPRNLTDLPRGSFANFDNSRHEVGNQITSKLRDAGIPGIKYLDQGSRTAGEGSRNYVVFRDDIISVVKKYGIAAAASMYGMDQVSQAMGEPEPQNPLMQGY